MTLMTRWEPMREFSAMQDRLNRMNRLFRESYSPEVPEEALTTTSYAPPVDIYEDEHNITLKNDRLPGHWHKRVVKSENVNSLDIVFVKTCMIGKNVPSWKPGENGHAMPASKQFL